MIRRIAKIAALLGVMGFTLALYPDYKKLPELVLVSGWLLLAVMAILAGYNVWKKLPFLPLGTSEGWLQFHIYAGFFTVALFLVHVRLRWPHGRFEQWLAVFYLSVTVSGIAGLYITRVFPRRLTARGGEVIYEQIPFIRRQLQQAAESIALETVTLGKSTIADFYADYLATFFSKRRNFPYHLIESRIPLNRLQAKIAELNRFLDQRERERMEQIAGFVRQKDGLDYHYALQSMLKLWLFVHIPLTYGLILMVGLHLILITAFSGGVR